MKTYSLFLFFFFVAQTEAQLFNHIDSLSKFAVNAPSFVQSFGISDDDSIPPDKKIRNLEVLKKTKFGVGYFLIQNSALERIDNLDSLSSVNDFKIFNNGYLTSIGSMENVNNIATIQILTNSALQKIDINFNKMKYLRILYILNNPSLKSIQLQFPSLQIDSNHIDPLGLCYTLATIRDNDSLQEIKMNFKNYVLTALEAIRNKRLQKIEVNKFNYDFWGLLIKRNIEQYSVGQLYYRSYLLIKDNPELTTFTGFKPDSITLCHCEIMRNRKLSNLCLLNYAFNHPKFPELPMEKYFIVDSNAAGANSFQEVKAKDCTTASIISPAASNTLVLYPNPTHEVLYYALTPSVKKIRLFNIAGEEMQIKTNYISSSLSTETLPHGMYMLQVTDNTGTLHYGKFVKE